MMIAFNNSHVQRGLPVTCAQQKRKHNAHTEAVFHIKADPGGFTLIEVMVAMAIIAMIMVSLFRMQSSTIDLAGADEFQTTAMFLAKSQLAIIERSLGDGFEQDRGTFGPEFRGYEWECEVRDVGFTLASMLSDNDSGQLKKIDLTIEKHTGDRFYHVETFRYHPGK